jgi:hypothetical protein
MAAWLDPVNGGEDSGFSGSAVNGSGMAGLDAGLDASCVRVFAAGLDPGFAIGFVRFDVLPSPGIEAPVFGLAGLPRFLGMTTTGAGVVAFNALDAGAADKLAITSDEGGMLSRYPESDSTTLDDGLNAGREAGGAALLPGGAVLLVTGDGLLCADGPTRRWPLGGKGVHPGAAPDLPLGAEVSTLSFERTVAWSLPDPAESTLAAVELAAAGVTDGAAERGCAFGFDEPVAGVRSFVLTATSDAGAGAILRADANPSAEGFAAGRAEADADGTCV